MQHSNPLHLRAAAAAVLCALAAGGAFAQTTMQPSGRFSDDRPAAPNPLPAERTQGLVSFVSGGVGTGEAERFKAAFRDYPLVIELYERSGDRGAEYTAEADVRITDASGRLLLDQHADGPFMLVRLAPGEYRVQASLKGKMLPEQRVKVNAQGTAHTTFVFPARTG